VTWGVAWLCGAAEPGAGADWALAGLVASGLLLDIGAIADQALGRRAVNLLRPEARGRLNGLFTGFFFVGGALGSWLTGAAYAWRGWDAVCAVGAGFALAAIAIDLGTHDAGHRCQGSGSNATAS
jgi:predicted MFS family arabinose efflux permease